MGKGHLKEHMLDQEMYEKMPSITNHQKNSCKPQLDIISRVLKFTTIKMEEVTSTGQDVEPRSLLKGM
jgi:hypothetical protein